MRQNPKYILAKSIDSGKNYSFPMLVRIFLSVLLNQAFSIHFTKI